MRRTVTGIVALLLGIGAHAQNTQHQNVPSMEMQDQSTRDHQQGTAQMEMLQSTVPNVSAVQESENPNQKTGSYVPIPDLLEGAKALPARNLDEFESFALKNNPTGPEPTTATVLPVLFAAMTG